MNRKKVIEGIFFVAVVIGIILGFTMMAYERDELRKTLDEKENVISDMGKTVETLNEQNQELENNLINVGQEVADLKDNLMKTSAAEKQLRNDKEKLQSDLSKLNGEVKTLKSELAKKNTELAKKTKPVVASTMPSRGERAPEGKTIYMSATAYTAYCAGCSGVTATGINLRANPGLKVIAVDPSIIPLGTKVHVDGYGYAIAGDTGGAIKGHKIDLFMSSKSDALAWGRKTVQVKVLN